MNKRETAYVLGLQAEIKILKDQAEERKKIVTKADEIRNMTDNQLSWFIWGIVYTAINLCAKGGCDYCEAKGKLCCKDDMDEWMKSPAEKKGA